MLDNRDNAASDSEDVVEIVEAYQDYNPPINIMMVANRLMQHVPPICLRGLDRIVLTNSAALPRDLRRGKTRARKRKVRIAECSGLYHRKTSSQQAYIDIFVDNIRQYKHRAFRAIPFLRDMALAHTLYHEIGHHIHATLRREYCEREDVADKWAMRLTAQFVRQRYSYLAPLFWLNRLLVRTKWFQKRFPRPTLTS